MTPQTDTNFLLAKIDAGKTLARKNKPNIVYKDFNNDGKIFSNEIYMVNINSSSIFNGKNVNLTNTWIDNNGDGMSDVYIKKFKKPNTNEIINTEIYKAENNNKNTSLNNLAVNMNEKAKESDIDFYENPEKYNNKSKTV